jgi:FdhE protein
MDNNLDTGFDQERDKVERAIALARVEKPAYTHLYPLLEAIFLSWAEAKGMMSFEIPDISDSFAKTKWENGFPLLNRWDFPIDPVAAARVLRDAGKFIPEDNRKLADAHTILNESLALHSGKEEQLWGSFMHHEMEPWDEWIKITLDTDLASILFLARITIRPALEFTAAKLIAKHPAPDSWLKGYCPVCGSLPSLLYLEGEGERKAFCSWCSTEWSLHRLQCPYCDNRYHQSLGYISLENERQNRITYCNLCRFYFKQIDTRDLAYPPYLALEEWTTLHLDFLAQKAGWISPPSPAPAIYGKSE